MKLRVVVLGSSGFIGSHLVESMNSNLFDVSGVDLRPSQNQSPLCTTVTSTAGLVQHLKENKYDVVINCIGSANVQSSYEKPLLDFELNSKTTLEILEALRSQPQPSKFINLSSAAVYGNPKVSPVPESAEKNPISPYGLNKSIAEEISFFYFKAFRVPTCNLRIFSVYGPRQRKMLFWDIYKKAKNTQNNQIELFGTGLETRDFIYILDLVSAIETVILKAPFCGEKINVASGESIQIKDAAKRLIEILNPDLGIRFTGNLKVGDPTNWCSDIRYLISLGFKPQYNFEKGILETGRWMLQVPSI